MLLKLSLAVCLALSASQAFAQTNTQASVDAETTAECELMHYGATITSVYANYIGTDPPKLPRKDENGEIHPSSCNPHVNFHLKKIDKKKLTSLFLI